MRLVLLAAAAILIDGYHFGTDDAEIYIPAIKHFVNPRLYPFGAEFFLGHARFSLFAPLVGGTTLLLHLSVEGAVLLWHLVCVIALLAAGWDVARTLFSSSRACWGAVGLLAACLPVPVAGIALVISDPYLSARSFSAPLGLLALSSLLRGRLARAAMFTLLTALFHPQMAVYCVAFAGLFWAFGRYGATPQTSWTRATSTAACLAVPGALAGYFEPATGAYRTVLYARTYFFAGNWEWYEWVGAIAPLLLLLIVARSRWGRQRPVRAQTCSALIALALISTMFFLIVSADHRFDTLTRLQPMRSFHIVYLFLFLILGGLLGEYVLRARPAAWLALFLPIAAGMYAFDRSDYPFSPHLEWPGWAGGSVTGGNPWMEAFRWVRTSTPVEAVFALDPNTMAIPADDRHGFRALGERSALADAYKDSGAAAMFPHLVPDWAAQQQLQAGWTHFSADDFARLAAHSPVTWVVVENRLSLGLLCPYRNRAVSVCRVEADRAHPSQSTAVVPR